MISVKRWASLGPSSPPKGRRSSGSTRPGSWIISVYEEGLKLDIIKLPIEYSASVLDSRFRLVLIAAQRARQISDGSPVLVKSKYVKNTTLALEEAIEDKLKYLTGEDARKAREMEYRMRRERMARQSMEEAAAASLEKMEEIKEAYKSETVVMAAEEDEMLGDESDEDFGDEEGSDEVFEDEEE
ncbi:MAG: DNA-directed RNA polymerase subunit omega [Nitrospirae bacterium]|nr:DNA-directed RNA polymerase subunit omega [Nitrospirota bacterium]